jgi:trehalose/maltose hydrolase-like predicted phosphorylase
VHAAESLGYGGVRAESATEWARIWRDHDNVGRAHHHFRGTASVDLLRTQHAVVGGTFIGGIHTAACGGTLQLAVAGFGGLGHHGDELVIEPHLPSHWTSMTYRVTWRGQRLRVTITDEVTVTADPADDAAVDVIVDGERRSITP